MGITTGHLVRSSPLLPSEIVVSYKFCQVTWQLRIKLLCTCSNVTSGSCSDSRNSSCSTLWSNVAEYPNRCHPKYVISPSHTCTRVWIGCVAAQQGFHFFFYCISCWHTRMAPISSHTAGDRCLECRRTSSWNGVLQIFLLLLCRNSPQIAITNLTACEHVVVSVSICEYVRLAVISLNAAPKL